MPDLNQRFRGIDRLSPPDLLSEARVKAEEGSSGRSGVAATPMRRLATIVVALAFGLSGVAALFLAFGDEQRTEPGAAVPARIVFSSLIFPDAPGQIYAMAPDGSDLVQLIRGAESYSSVRISPDGERMAYVRLERDAGSGGRPGPEAIYVANADGTDATEVFRSSETPQSIVELDWSPDGRSLGFVLRSIPPGKSSEADWPYDLWVMSADGSDPRRVSDDRITSFSWSPTGDRFAVTKETFAGNRSGDDIFVIGLDGSNLARLTTQGASRDPIWSPDGQRILFAEGWGPDGPRVMVMRADGSDVEPLAVRYDGWTEPLAWAPDSQQVLVRGGNDRHQCSMLLVSVAGAATSVLLEGTTPLATRSFGAGETPSAIGDPCVESASWSGVTPSSQTTAADVSRAPQTVRVPEVVGLSPEKAEVALIELGLSMESEVVTGTYTNAAVIEQEPEPGTIVEVGGTVKVVIGPAQDRILVPDVAGLRAHEALVALKEAGLLLRTEQTQSKDVAEGIVISQDPAAGTYVDPGTTVTIAVSSGPPSGSSVFRCPDASDAVAVTAADADAAVATAEQSLWGPDAKAVLDPVGTENGLEPGSGTGKETVLGTVIGGRFVAPTCGMEVADATYAVTFDDGTDSASLDFTLYVIHRSDGWKVWGRY
jgi:Tol biopolymer transport system component